LSELEDSLGIPVLPVVTVREMVDILRRGGNLSDELMARIGDYLRQHAPVSDSK
jgi:hypothetical protein